MRPLPTNCLSWLRGSNSAWAVFAPTGVSGPLPQYADLGAGYKAVVTTKAPWASALLT